MITDIYLAENCKLVDVIDLKAVSGKYDGPEYILDSRHNVLSKNNTDDWEMYFNYINTIKPLSKGKNVRMKYMLDLGYIPLCMPPSYVQEKFYMVIKSKLNKVGLPYVEERSTSFILSDWSGAFSDVWVSKIQAGEFFNMAPVDVRVENVLRRLFT